MWCCVTDLTVKTNCERDKNQQNPPVIFLLCASLIRKYLKKGVTKVIQVIRNMSRSGTKYQPIPAADPAETSVKVSGSPSQPVMFMPPVTHATPSAKQQKQPEPRQPKRTTKTSQKLTLFPKDVLGEDAAAADEAFSHDTGPTLPHVSKSEPDQLLSRLERRWLPRVTGYCTAR